jgi:ABC-type uncharacterized transport system substrate-binding protein
MKVQELNSILVYCKVKEIYHIEYITAIGDLTPNLQDMMELYCHKNKKSFTVSEIVKTAKKNGYKE